MPTRYEDWIDDDEYPDDRDVDDFGDDSPIDRDRLTIGFIPKVTAPFWTRTRIIIAVIAIILVLAFILEDLSPMF
jgi:hypothetical protein